MILTGRCCALKFDEAEPIFTGQRISWWLMIRDHSQKSPPRWAVKHGFHEWFCKKVDNCFKYKPSPDGRFVIGFTVNTTSSLLCPLPLLLGCTPHCLEISTLDCSFWLIALGEWFAPLPCVYPSGGEVRHLLVWPMLSQTCWWKEQQRNITPSMSCGSKFKTQETIEFVLSSINRLSFRVANCLTHHFLQIK